MKRLIWAICQRVELCFEALAGSVSDGLRPNLTQQNVTRLPARDNIALMALLENELETGMVSPSSHSTSSTTCNRGTV